MRRTLNLQNQITQNHIIECHLYAIHYCTSVALSLNKLHDRNPSTYSEVFQYNIEDLGVTITYEGLLASPLRKDLSPIPI